MYTVEQFEQAILALGKPITLVEVKLAKGNRVRRFIGRYEGRRIEWQANGEALCGHKLVPELNVKPGDYGQLS